MLKRSYAITFKTVYPISSTISALGMCVTYIYIYMGGDQISSFGLELFGRTLEFGIITSPRILTNLSPD
jgi:hypothetical protein